MSATVLVIAAHPDDEILGCGGTVARHVAEGDRVHSVLLAEGATSRDTERDINLRGAELDELREAGRKAAECLGAAAPIFCGLPDQRLDELSLLDIIKKVEEIVAEIAPNVIYTHHRGDLNNDHRIVHNAVLTACRPLPQSSISHIYAFETVSSTEWAPGREDAFVPDHFVGIENHLGPKLASLRCYETEMRDFPHPRSIEAVETLARWRGATVGLAAAEAFVTVRTVRRLSP